MGPQKKTQSDVLLKKRKKKNKNKKTGRQGATISDAGISEGEKHGAQIPELSTNKYWMRDRGAYTQVKRVRLINKGSSHTGECDDAD